MKKKIIAAILILLILILSIGYWQYTITKPKHSLGQIKEAVGEHNLVMFEKYMDTTGLVESLVDQFIATGMENIEKKEDGVEGFDPALAKRIQVNYRPQLTNVVKQELVSLVKTGDFEGEDRSKFQGIEYVREEGKIAHIGLNFYSEKNEENVIVNLRMRRVDNYWQVIEVMNVSDIVKKLDQWDDGQFKALKRSILKQIKEKLIADKIEKYNFGEVLSEKVNVELKPGNERSKIVKNFKTRHFYDNSSEKQAKRMSLIWDEKISPEQSDGDNLSSNVNKPINFNEELYKKEQEKFEKLYEWSYMQEIFKW